MKNRLFGRLEQELAAREQGAGLTVADLLDLPDAERSLMVWMMRQNEVGLPEVVAQIGQDEAAAQALVRLLVERGFVHEMHVDGVVRYTPHLGARRSRTLPRKLWSALDDTIEKEGEE